MWRDESLLLIAVGSRTLEFRDADGKGPQRVHTAPFAGTSGEISLASLTAGLESLVQQALASRPAGKPARRDAFRLRVLVSDHWLMYQSVPWSGALLEPAGAQSYARAQLDDAGFDVLAGDVVRIDDGPYQEPKLVAAFPAALIDALRQAAQRLNARLESVAPVSMAARWLAGHDKSQASELLAVLEGDGVAFVQTHPGRTAIALQRLESENHASDPVRALKKYWQRLRLRDPSLAGIPRLQVLDLTVEGSAFASDQELVAVSWPVQEGIGTLPPLLRLAYLSAALNSPLDAVQRLPYAKPAHRMIALAAVIAALVALFGIFSLRSAVSEQEATLAALSPSVSNKKPAAWNKEERARVQVVNAAIRELNLPIAKLLRAMQPPQNIRVALLGIEIAPTKGRSDEDGASAIKVMAEARSGAEMTQYVDFLSEQEPFLGAYLLRHEVMDTEGRPYRFTLEAIWRD